MPTFVFIPVKGSDYNTIRLRFFDENYRSQKCDKSSQKHDSSRIVETAIHRVCIVKTTIHRVSCSGKISGVRHFLNANVYKVTQDLERFFNYEA